MLDVPEVMCCIVLCSFSCQQSATMQTNIVRVRQYGLLHTPAQATLGSALGNEVGLIRIAELVVIHSNCRVWMVKTNHSRSYYERGVQNCCNKESTRSAQAMTGEPHF